MAGRLKFMDLDAQQRLHEAINGFICAMLQKGKTVDGAHYKSGGGGDDELLRASSGAGVVWLE